MRAKIHNTSATTFILLALVPYTHSNLLLAFKPNKFFDELDKLTEHSKKNVKLAYYRAVKNGWVSIENNKVSLSYDARLNIEPFMASNLHGAKLMVIFDIPEEYAFLRRKLRGVLKHLGFKQIQQSVWSSDRDYREIISETIQHLNISQWVQVYEAREI